jgi:hypothetical protein
MKIQRQIFFELLRTRHHANEFKSREFQLLLIWSNKWLQKIRGLQYV